MNYISEINEFYDWLETNQLPKSAIALWNALMHINNKARWVQAFPVAISTIESKTGFKRSELFEARNILQQKGRLCWKQRGGNLSAEYELIPFCVHIADANGNAKGYAVPDAKAYTKPTQKHTILKLNKDKTKHIIDKPPNIEDVREYFKLNSYFESSADKFFDYYNVGNWHDCKGNKVKNWKQKAQAVWFKPENKVPENLKPALTYSPTDNQW